MLVFYYIEYKYNEDIQLSPKVISFSGKGGVGKSTLLVLMLKHVIETEKYENILVIDADPDANIGDIIGKEIKFSETIGGKMTKLQEKIQKRQIPLEVSKNQIIESEVFDALIEMDDFDLIEMGRSEGEGCFCSVNNALKRIIDVLAKNYDIVLIDAPAGLEYFARKTGQDVTDLIIVTDPSKMGFHTMERIVEVSKEVHLKFKHILVIGNRFPEDLEELISKRIENIDDDRLKFLGILPYDEEISTLNLTGDNLLKLSNDNALYKSAKTLFASIV
ncbi:MAG: ATP-binding protein [Promethearchaeota archaeon]|nr:MAG: ATP-binding protein [Candidatus Lokiarchaeota archaeon]